MKVCKTIKGEISMKTQFNKASRTDGTLVTLNLRQFDNEFDIDRKYLSKNSRIIVDIDGHEVFFYVNRIRNSKAVTAVTHCFPRFRRLPQVGCPVFAEVDQLEVIY
jgi:hypothetical protein